MIHSRCLAARNYGTDTAGEWKQREKIGDAEKSKGTVVIGGGGGGGDDGGGDGVVVGA